MNISEFYKYSWFADLAYVEWDDDNKSGDKAVDTATAAKRTPQVLAKKIFSSDNANENYPVLSYFANEESNTGFKASLYGNARSLVRNLGSDLEKVMIQDLAPLVALKIEDRKALQ